jgi:hypothetical protein
MQKTKLKIKGIQSWGRKPCRLPGNMTDSFFICGGQAHDGDV